MTLRGRPAAPGGGVLRWVVVIGLGMLLVGLVLWSGGGSAGREPVSPAASLVVHSRPVGARVFIDGVLRGETPLMLEMVPGRYEVCLSLSGHLGWEARVELKEGVEQPLFVRLLPEDEGRED